MTMRHFTEDTQLSGIRKTNDGYLTGLVDCARTGIQEYLGSELGIDDMDVVRMYRPESVVFDKSKLATYAGKPATNDHPPESVNKDNWKKYSVGQIGEDVLRNGDYVTVPLILMDGATIDQVENGKRELSMGYAMDFEIQSGTTPDEQDYDAVMTDYAINHIAVVDRGRAGSKARIGDNLKPWGISPLTNDGNKPMTTRTITVDGISIETTDQGAQAIERLQSQIVQLNTDAETTQATHDTAIAAKDTELATKDTEIEKLKGDVLDADALDAKVTARSELIANASKLAKDADFKGMDDQSIIKTAVIAVRGEDAMKDKSDAYLEATFDSLLDMAKDEKPDSFRDSIINRETPKAEDNGQSTYEKRMSDAWKQPNKAVA